MILSPSKNDRFDKAKTIKEKARIVFDKEKKDTSDAIALAYEKYLNPAIPKHNAKDFILYKFSQCKELYDRYLAECECFQNKSSEEKVSVFYDFLRERTPEDWIQKECNYNNYSDIEDENVIIDNREYNINDIDIINQNFTVQAIYKKYTYEEIDLNPDFQRSKIWTSKQKSLLIESLLINIPIPAFYLDARTSGKWIVIDGLQRLSTIMDFLDDSFKLSETEYLDLKGKTFSTLERKYQRRIEDYELSFNLVKPSTPIEIAFNIFSRINSLGTPLSAQEIRHAMNMGTATSFLQQLSKTDEFIQAISKENYKSLSKRMNDKALILRYLSFKLLGYEKKDKDDKNDLGYLKNDMNAFLINGMKELNKLDFEKDKDYLQNIQQIFQESMKKAYVIFGDKCFRKFFKLNENKKAPINLPLFETLTLTLEKYTIEEVQLYKNDIVNIFLNLFNEIDTIENMDEGKFLDWISSATNNPDNVKKRFEKVNQIFKDIIGH
jgi:uncharacterized protein with ParB-like and HNH nuclease domain